MLIRRAALTSVVLNVRCPCCQALQPVGTKSSLAVVLWNIGGEVGNLVVTSSHSIQGCRLKGLIGCCFPDRGDGRVAQCPRGLSCCADGHMLRCFWGNDGLSKDSWCNPTD